MNETPRILPRILDEKNAALYLGVSRSFLQKARSRGRLKGQLEGPKFFRQGRRIWYRVEDLDEWLRNRQTQVTI